MSVPERLTRTQTEDQVKRLRKAVSSIHQLLIYDGDEGLKDLQKIFPELKQTPISVDKTVMDDFVYPITIYLRGKYRKIQYEKDMDTTR